MPEAIINLVGIKKTFEISANDIDKNYKCDN
jgi:hypothetical protein